MAHMRQSRPDSGLGFQVKVLTTIQGLTFSLVSVEIRDYQKSVGRVASGQNTVGVQGSGFMVQSSGFRV